MRLKKPAKADKALITFSFVKEVENSEMTFRQLDLVRDGPKPLQRQRGSSICAEGD